MQCFLVGGAVRDQLLGYPVHERDWVVVGATPEEMIAAGFSPVGRDFPVFLHPDSHEEYALARTERKSGHGYRGFECFSSPDVTLEEDLSRRDLTINAMAMTPAGDVIDPYGGRRDLEARLLRHVSPAFSEDPLRLLRVARFAARYQHLGFTVAPETAALMNAMVASGEADYLVPERTWKEVARALDERDPSRFFAILDACGALTAIAPELTKLPPTAWRRLDLSARAALATTERFAALTATLPELALKSLCQRWKCPNEFRDLAVLVARHHEQAVALATAEDVFDLLQQSDALRRPQRFHQFLACCLLLGLHAPQAERLRQALRAALSVVARDIASRGLQGPALGAALQAARQQAVLESWDQ